MIPGIQSLAGTTPVEASVPHVEAGKLCGSRGRIHRIWHGPNWGNWKQWVHTCRHTHFNYRTGKKVRKHKTCRIWIEQRGQAEMGHVDLGVYWGYKMNKKSKG